MAQVKVFAKLDTSILLIGDQTKFTLEVHQPSNVKILFPSFNDSIGSIDLVAVHPVDTVIVTQPPSLYLTQTLVITAFDSGYYVIPPMRFYYSESGGPLDSIDTEPFVLTVNTMHVDTSLAIKEIKPPMDVPFSWKEALPYIIGGIVFLIIAFLAYYFWKNRKIALPILKKIPTRPAHEIALEALDKINAEKIWQQGHSKKYQSEIADTLRTYIENRFFISAMELTTDEIMQNFNASFAKEELRTSLKIVLELADLVKFAKVQPLPDQNQNSIDRAYHFVRETMIVEEFKEESEGSKKEEEKEQ